MGCICLDKDGINANEFFHKYLKICLYDWVDILSYICGLLNIMLWMTAQFPQIIKTFRTKQPESLSVTFLIIWIIGDITNLLGCLLTNQTQIQLLTSVYFVVVDCIMIFQYFFYTKCSMCRKKKQNGIEECENKVIEMEKEEMKEEKIIIEDNSRFIIILIMIITVFSINNKSESTNDQIYSICGNTELNIFERIIGDISSWVSGILYLTSRFPQIFHIYKTKEVKGISVSLFIISTLANIFYSLSLFLNGIDFKSVTFYESTLAYIVGSFFVIPTSIIIISQYYYYAKLKPYLNHHSSPSPSISQEQEQEIPISFTPSYQNEV